MLQVRDAEGGFARRRGLRSPPLSLEALGALLGPDGEDSGF